MQRMRRYRLRCLPLSRVLQDQCLFTITLFGLHGFVVGKGMVRWLLSSSGLCWQTRLHYRKALCTPPVSKIPCVGKAEQLH